MLFDARAAKLLQPGQHITVDDAPGLRLVCSTAGLAWTYRFKSPLDGRMRQLKLGTWPAMSAAAAGAAWEAQRQAREAGRDPARERRQARHAERVQAAAAGSVGELLQGYLAGPCAARAPKGRAEVRRLLEGLAQPIAQLAPAQVTRSVAYDLVDGCRGAPVIAAQLRRELGAAWEWGHDSGRLADDVPNWWRLILRGKLASRGKIIGGEHQGVTKRVLTLAEVGAVLRHLPHISQQVGELLTLYLWTGCRGAEIVAMVGAELTQEADGWWWTVPRAKLKMARHPLATDLRVPLVGRALGVVLARRDVYGAGQLFPSCNRRATTAHVQQKVVGVEVWSHMPGKEKRYARTVHPWPVVGWAPHDLRRTVRTQLAVMGCPAEVAEAVLGHIQAGVVGVYNRHQYDGERRLWLMRLAEAWESAAARG